MLGGDFVYGFLLAQVHVDRAFGMKIRGYDLTKKKKKEEGLYEVVEGPEGSLVKTLSKGKRFEFLRVEKSLHQLL